MHVRSRDRRCKKRNCKLEARRDMINRDAEYTDGARDIPLRSTSGTATATATGTTGTTTGLPPFSTGTRTTPSTADGAATSSLAPIPLNNGTSPGAPSPSPTNAAAVALSGGFAGVLAGLGLAVWVL